MSIDGANSSMGEPDVVGRAALGVYPDVEAAESGRELNHSALEFEESFATHQSDQHVRGIHQFDSLAGVGRRIRLVDLRRRFQSESFMWTTVIEIRSPEIASPLLFLGIRRRKNFDLHSNVAVHSLVPSVVRRGALSSADVLDAETDPPSGQLGEPKLAVGSHEWVTIVRQNHVRDAVQLEEAFEQQHRLRNLW